MAKTLKEMPANARASYPWDQWLDGQVWSLVEGEDYTVATNNVRTAAHAAAKARGGRAHTAVTDDGVAIQFINEPPRTRAPKQAADAPAKTAAKRPAGRAAAAKKARRPKSA